jgi:hypothetical protein
MTTLTAPTASAARPASRLPRPAAWRLFRLELRRSAMLWLLPLAIVLFWYSGYRQVMALPAMWNLRAMSLQNHILLGFELPVVGAAAWMGSREARRQMADMLTGTARPRWSRQLATWAATTCLAMLGYLACVGVVYLITARQATGGGPLWWPVVVGAVGIPALTSVGFAAGALLPSRFTTPLIAIVVFFAIGFSQEGAKDSHSFLVLSPVISGAPDIGADPGIATFYHYLPDLSIAQVMFLAGLTIAVLGVVGLPPGSGGRLLRGIAATITVAGLAAAGTAVALAGTARLDQHGMLVIPALHDAASDQPISYTPVCIHTAIPICVNPAYAGYLPTVTAALEPVLSQVAGLPGAPAEVSQQAEIYVQRSANGISTLATGARDGAVFHMILPDGLPGSQGMTSAAFDAQLQQSTGLNIVTKVIGGPGRPYLHPSQAQLAVISALAGPWTLGAPVPENQQGPRESLALVPRGSPAAVAAKRFAALPAAERHAWLVRNLAALRAGKITLAQLP